MNADRFMESLDGYEAISNMLRSWSYEDIFVSASENMGLTKEEMSQVVLKSYESERAGTEYPFVLLELMKNVANYDWLFQHLADNKSKEVFALLMRQQILPDGQRNFQDGETRPKSVINTGGYKSTDDRNQKIDLEVGRQASARAEIIGIKNRIKEEIPKIALCIKEQYELWELPKLVFCINAIYEFYIEYEENREPKVTVYAFPKEQKQIKRSVEIDNSKTKHIVALAPFERWSNVELIKDFGMVPYLLYKNHGCEVSMVGAGGWEYPYEELIKGVKLEFLPDGTEESKLAYIGKYAKETDCLIFQGCYSTNFAPADLYKNLNPQGRIYCALDANSAWMDRILWFQPEFMHFMEQCDVIATSGQAMQEHLNQKWPWRIAHIPNGYYSFFDKEHKKPSFAQKENRILTSGRIGSPQKANHILLEAFAKIADNIPDWTLRLVGEVEEEFQEYIQQYFERFPRLKERVSFAGNIQDRQELFQEYLQAKIFAMTSVREGGTPNVIAEALNAGCVIALTKIDSYQEAIDGGRCGLSAPMNDIPAFADILLKLCKDEDLQELSDRAFAYGRAHFDMEQIVKRLYGMIFGGQE